MVIPKRDRWRQDSLALTLSLVIPTSTSPKWVLSLSWLHTQACTHTHTHTIQNVWKEAFNQRKSRDIEEIVCLVSERGCGGAEVVWQHRGRPESDTQLWGKMVGCLSQNRRPIDFHGPLLREREREREHTAWTTCVCDWFVCAYMWFVTVCTCVCVHVCARVHACAWMHVVKEDTYE